jgi:hypothetical protein
MEINLFDKEGENLNLENSFQIFIQNLKDLNQICFFKIDLSFENFNSKFEK